MQEQEHEEPAWQEFGEEYYEATTTQSTDDVDENDDDEEDDDEEGPVVAAFSAPSSSVPPIDALSSSSSSSTSATTLSASSSAAATTTTTTQSSAKAAAASSSTSVVSFQERTELMNQQLGLELAAAPLEHLDLETMDLGVEIRDAALRSRTPTSTSLPTAAARIDEKKKNRENRRYDPRFGRAALRKYRAFVSSSTRYSTPDDYDPILLAGYARRIAKQIRNMIYQQQQQQQQQQLQLQKNQNKTSGSKTTNIYFTKGATTTTANQNKGTATTKPTQTNTDDYTQNPPQHFREKIAHSMAKQERRERDRANRHVRTLCPGCARPPTVCLCPALAAIGVDTTNSTSSRTSSINTSTSDSLNTSLRLHHTDIVILQHPNEFRKRHTSTTPLVQLVLGTAQVRIHVAYQCTLDELRRPEDEDDDAQYLLLFPGPGALDLATYVAQQPQQPQQQDDADPDEEIGDDVTGINHNDQVHHNNNNNTKTTTTTTQPRSKAMMLKTKIQKKKTKKYTLILVDGTWTEAKRMIRESPSLLQDCQMVQFAFDDDPDDDDNRDIDIDIDIDTDATKKEWNRNTNNDDTSKYVIKNEKCFNQRKSRSIYNAMRKEPNEFSLSTLEACGKAVSILEGDQHHHHPTSKRRRSIETKLKTVLTHHVALHLQNAKQGRIRHGSRNSAAVKASKLRRAQQIEQALYGTSQMNSTTTGTGTPRGTIRPLVEGDIPLIDSWWEQGGTVKSSTIIARALQNDRRHPTDEQRLCLGITLEESVPKAERTTTDTDDNDGKNNGTHHTTLIACIVRYETGAVGLLHVQKNFRNRGYGSLLLREATRRMIRHHNDTNKEKKNNKTEETMSNDDDDTAVLEACIRDGNSISEAVFTNCGWRLADPTLKKKGTGTRRSNRKWIYPYEVDTKLHCNTPLSE